MVLKMVRMRGTILFQWPKIARGQKAIDIETSKIIDDFVKAFNMELSKGSLSKC